MSNQCMIWVHGVRLQWFHIFLSTFNPKFHEISTLKKFDGAKPNTVVSIK